MVVQSSQPYQTLHSVPVNMTVDSIAQSFADPLHDFCSYRITIKEISLDIATQLLNELNGNINFHQDKYVFYQQRNNRVYQVKCEIVLPSLIINFLNKSVYGIETELNIE